MKPSEIREMGVEEAQQQLEEREVELSHLQLRLATHQLENPLVIRRVRRDIARIKTVLREHEMGIKPLPGAKPEGESTEQQEENQSNG